MRAVYSIVSFLPLNRFSFQGDSVAGDSTIVHKAGVVGLSLTKDSVFSIGTDAMLTTLDVSAGVGTLFSPASYSTFLLASTITHMYMLCRQTVSTSTGIGGTAICLANARSKPGTFVYANKGKKLTLVVGGKVKAALAFSYLLLVLQRVDALNMRAHGECICPTRIDPTRRRRALQP